MIGFKLVKETEYNRLLDLEIQVKLYLFQKNSTEPSYTTIHKTFKKMKELTNG